MRAYIEGGPKTPFTTHHVNATVRAEVIFIENVHRIYTAEAGQHHFW